MAKADSAQIDRLADMARDGDRQAFSQIVKMMMNQVTALTYRMTGDRDAGQDLAQDTFVAAWQKLDSFRGEAAFTSWIYRIASNKSLNYLKSAGRKRTESLDKEESGAALEPSHDETPETNLAREELREQFLEFAKTLPDQQRVVFELRFYQQMSFDEISRVIDKAEGTVKTHYRLAVEKLRKHAQERGWRS